MAITTLDEVLEFLDIETAYFIITPSNNSLTFTSSSGGPVTLNLTSGNYDGDGLATHVQTVMNANTTLTGIGTITFAVSYSSSTRKFSINSGTGKTIAYTHSSSSAGLTLGFTADKTAIQTITSDIPAGDPSQVVSSIKDAVEEVVKSYCNRSFEETSYRFERYNGKGQKILQLFNFPVTAVDRVSIGQIDVISVKNTNIHSVASVSVTPLGIRLFLDGVADTSITFALNPTMNNIVNAINAIGSGWEAKINSPLYSDFKSTEIIPVYGLNAIWSYWAYLTKPNMPLDFFDVYLERGQIINSTPFPVGNRNIFVDYTAGFDSTNMPSDLKLAIKILVQFYYNKRDDGSFGLKSYGSSRYISATFDKDETIPKEVKDILFGYKRMHA
ncbi:MAG: hypothetical protein ACYC5G_02095 [Candidatus Doudnabacteria bacterium]